MPALSRETPEGADLRAELLERFGRGLTPDWTEREFNDLALRVFSFQYGAVPLYRRFCDGRALSPGRVTDWTEIPPVPTSAFKRYAFHSDLHAVERIFRTSGTTRGRDGRGEHHVADLQLYYASLLPNFSARVIPDTPEPAVVCLLPHPDLAPDSSLSWMMHRVAADVRRQGGGFFLDPDRGLDVRALEAELSRLAAEGGAVVVAGTAFAFVSWLEESPSWEVDLPSGSVVMETGGFKGRTREVSRADLQAALSRRLGLATDRIIGEYGMTELLSQYYEPIRDVVAGQRVYRGPPWLRARVLDPATLSAANEGETGILAHFDLANLFSVSAVLTEDLGIAINGGFRLLGRSAEAEPRGCSLAVEEIARHARTADNHAAGDRT